MPKCLDLLFGEIGGFFFHPPFGFEPSQLIGDILDGYSLNRDEKRAV